MRSRFYIDPETERPHTENHGVSMGECIEVLRHSVQDFASGPGSRQALGPTRGGRLLKVVYTIDNTSGEAFVITAYPLDGKQLKAYRRRNRRR